MNNCNNTETITYTCDNRYMPATATEHSHILTHAKQLLKETKTELVARIVAAQHNLSSDAALQFVHDACIVDAHIIKPKKAIDWSKQTIRRVALRVAYIGTPYHGFAIQKDTKETVEEYLFHALEKTHLIESRKTCNFSKCGRTDKGVSAFGNVVSVDIRMIPSRDERVPANVYLLGILNKVLPDTIRITGADYVDSAFSARFSCKSRCYKYLLFEDNLDMEKMQDAASRLIGYHDFRNFCKMDLRNNQNFERCILEARVEKVNSAGTEHNSTHVDNLWCFTIRADGFLYHQVRFTVAVLLLVARGQETPDVIEDLLDINKVPSKPDYAMASELPLLLYECEFENLRFDPDVAQLPVSDLVTHFHARYRRSLLSTSAWDGLWRDILIGDPFREPSNSIKLQTLSLPQVSDRRTRATARGMAGAKLLARPRGKSMEERVQMMSEHDRKVFHAKRSRTLLFQKLREEAAKEAASMNQKS